MNTTRVNVKTTMKKLLAFIICSTTLIHASAAPAQDMHTLLKHFAQYGNSSVEAVAKASAAAQVAASEFEAFASGKAPAECHAKATELQKTANTQIMVLKAMFRNESAQRLVTTLFNSGKNPLAKIEVITLPLDGLDSCFVQAELLKSKRCLDLCDIDDLDLPSSPTGSATTAVKATNWKGQ